MTEEKLCKCHLHSLISKHWEKSTNIQKHFRSLFLSLGSQLSCMYIEGVGYENFMPCLITASY